MTQGYKTRSAYSELQSLDEKDENALRTKAYPWSPNGEPSEKEIKQSMANYVSYREQWNACASKQIETSFPTNVDIELSSLCNLRCAMCNWGFDPAENPDPDLLKKFQEFKKNAGSMKPELFKQIVDEVVAEGGHAIKLNWRGEPLINSHAPELIKYAKDKGVSEVLMNTNATLLSPELADQIIESGLDMIIFSIDSLDKDTYESIRRGGDFVTTLSNIFNFIQARNRHKKRTGSPKPLIKIQMVLMDENRHEKELFEHLFSPIVDIISTQDYTNRGEKDDRLSDDNRTLGRRPCPQIWQRLIVTWDGATGMCCRDWDLYHPLGKIAYPEATIKNIWNGSQLNKIRSTHKSEELNKLDACKSCTYRESFKWK